MGTFILLVIAYFLGRRHGRLSALHKVQDYINRTKQYAKQTEDIQQGW